MNKEQSFGLRVKRIDMGIFEYAVYVAIGRFKNLLPYMKWKYNDKDLDLDGWEESRGCCISRHGYVPVIWLPKKPKTNREIATAAHESLHAVYNVIDWASIPRTRDTDEVVCHMLAHILNGILK